MFLIQQKKHENYQELIWILAKTDFKLRYQGSFLGYLWALLKPLMMFTVLNFVFSSIFNPRGTGNVYYSLQLLVSLILFNFFSEGTSAGMEALLSKAQLVTKIYVPRWIIILAATLNSSLIFLMNLLVIVGFFVYKQFLPSFSAVLFFLLFSFLVYVLILSFALFTAPWYVKFRDLSMIWEVLISILFYATPVFYSLSMMPEYIQRILLFNPMAFVIHFVKEALIVNRFPDLWQTLSFVFLVVAFFALSIFSYRKSIVNVAEEI